MDLLDGKNPSSQSCTTPYLEKPYDDCPYLLLDVRNNDEYNMCHITGGEIGDCHATEFPSNSILAFLKFR